MSFNRVVRHQDEGYVEAIIDGYEDWQSALQVIEEMMTAAEEMGVFRILLDFTHVDMRVPVSEASEIAGMFDNFAPGKIGLGIVLPTEKKARGVITVFADASIELGHAATYLADENARQRWVSELRTLRPSG